MNPELKKFLQKPVVGSVLAVASGISFFCNCVMMPLVGRAGSKAPHVATNRLAFLAVLGLTYILAALATRSKMLRRTDDKSPLPCWSLGLCLICTALYILLLTGLLAV